MQLIIGGLKVSQTVLRSLNEKAIQNKKPFLHLLNEYVLEQKKTQNTMKKIALILFFSLACYPLSSYSNLVFQYEISQRQKVLNENRKLAFQRTKANFLQNIRISEGLKLVPYICTAGQNTIGFGHANREKLQRITVLQADSILLADFEFALDFAQKKTGLTCECSLVLANFTFAHGMGAFLKSKIYTQKLYLNSSFLLQELETYKKTSAARKVRKFDKIVIESCKHKKNKIK